MGRYSYKEPRPASWADFESEHAPIWFWDDRGLRCLYWDDRTRGFEIRQARFEEARGQRVYLLGCRAEREAGRRWFIAEESKIRQFLKSQP